MTGSWRYRYQHSLAKSRTSLSKRSTVNKTKATFYETFENTLNQIAIDNNDIFSVHTEGDTAIRLFDERLITDTISDSSKRNEVAKAIINLLARVKFDETIFSQGFDFLNPLWVHDQGLQQRRWW